MRRRLAATRCSPLTSITQTAIAMETYQRANSRPGPAIVDTVRSSCSPVRVVNLLPLATRHSLCIAATRSFKFAEP